jgi:hypothetical protein
MSDPVEELRKHCAELEGFERQCAGFAMTPMPTARALSVLLDVLVSVREELDDRSDAEYVDGTPVGNWAMRKLVEVDEASSKAAEALK